MLGPKVTLRGLMIQGFMIRYRNNQEPYTCIILKWCLIDMDHRMDYINLITHKYTTYLQSKYDLNFDGNVFTVTPSPKERLQNLLDFIKSEGL